MTKIDLHVHIKRSHQLSHIRSILKTRTLDGIAVTNFWNISFAQWLKKKLPEFLIIVGKEVCSSHGHILAIGLQENIPDFLSPQETIDHIHAQNGVAILPHPFLFKNSIAPIGEFAAINFDAIELHNFRAAPLLFPNMLASLFLKNRQTPFVANSDAKDIVSIGRNHNRIPGKSTEEILESIRNGQISMHREQVWPTPRWAFNFAHLYLTHHQSSNCPICGDVYIRKLLKAAVSCSVCGFTTDRRVLCPQGHWICKRCRNKKEFTMETLLAYRKEIGVEV